MKENVLIFLSSIFVGLIMLSGPIASKLISIGPFITPAAVIIYALTFLITDIISEIYGKKTASFLVKLGVFGLVLGLLISYLASIAPGIIPVQSEAFNLIFKSGIRIYIASIVAFIFSQTNDVFVFHWCKNKTNGKHLWLRNNASTFLSQLIDTFIFITISFYGTGAPLVSLMVGQLSVKWIIAVLDTPIFYISVKYLKNKFSC